MAEAEQPQRLRGDREVTVDDVRQLMGASTPHFALQLRARIRTLIRGLPPEDPARLLVVAPGLAREGQPVQPRDLLLPQRPRRIVGTQRRDQLADPVAELQGEVGGGGAHELADVVDGDDVPGTPALGLLGFGHARQSTSPRGRRRARSRAGCRCAPGRRP